MAINFKSNPDNIYEGWPNTLDQFASYTYMFTLSAIRRSELASPSLLWDKPPHDIIARSGGIGPGKNSTPFGTEIIGTGIKDSRDTDFSPTNSVSPNIDVLDADTNILEQNLDIFFNRVSIETVQAGNELRRMARLSKISMELVEPYGVSLLNKVRAAATNCGWYNHTSAPFLLTLEFKGWDEMGNPIIPTNTNGLKRLIPIRLTKSDIQINEAGTKYTISAAAWSELGWLDQYDKVRGTGNTFSNAVFNIKQRVSGFFSAHQTPSLKNFRTKFQTAQDTPAKSLQTGAAKLQDAMNNLARSLNDLQEREVRRNLKEKPDIYEIIVDPGIFDGASLNANQAASVAAGGYSAYLKVGDSITEAIARTVMQGDYYKIIYDRANELWKAAAGVNNAETNTELFKNVNNIASSPLRQEDNTYLLDWFTITSTVEAVNDFDNKIKDSTRKITYRVMPYKIHLLNAVGPGMSLDESIYKNVKKVYNYIYTGLNKDILSLEIKYNVAYSQPKAIQELQSSAEKKDPSNENFRAAMKQYYNTGNRFSDPEFPWGSSVTVQTESNASVIGSESPATDQIYEYLTNPTGDLAKIEMTILGDPAFLPQDIYIPITDDKSVGAGNIIFQNKSWNEQLQCFNANWQEIVIRLNIKYPQDINENTGLMKTNNVAFNGIYRVYNVESVFENGKFTQNIQAARYKGQGKKVYWGTAVDTSGTKNSTNSTNSTTNSTDVNYNYF